MQYINIWAVKLQFDSRTIFRKFTDLDTNFNVKDFKDYQALH